MGSWEWSTYGTKYYKVDGFLLGSRIGYVDTLELGKNKGAKLGFPNGKILDTKLGATDGIDIGTFNSTELG